MKNISITYISIDQHKYATGVIKKIDDTVKSLNKFGFHTKLVYISQNIYGIINLFYLILTLKTKKNIIRFPGLLRTILISPLILFKRFFGYTFIFDLPTPLIVAFYEIKGTESNYFKIIYRWASIFLFYPWVLIPYNRIIQSGWEHPYFLCFIRNKTKLIGNGINVEKIQLKNRSNNKNKIVFICVAQIEFWHAIDRLILGLNQYYISEKKSNQIIEIIVVGEGNEKQNLEKLVNKLNLASKVRFTGNRIGKELDILFEESDIAVGSLGSHRVGLKISSPLKTREYASRGIPFISSDTDPDFSKKLPFIYNCDSNESFINIQSVIDWYYELLNSGYDFNEIRSYAEINLSFETKIRKMFLE